MNEQKYLCIELRYAQLITNREDEMCEKRMEFTTGLRGICDFIIPQPNINPIVERQFPGNISNSPFISHSNLNDGIKQLYGMILCISVAKQQRDFV